VKYRVQPQGVAPAATALRKQEIIQEVDTKRGHNSRSCIHFSDRFPSYRVKILSVVKIFSKFRDILLKECN